MTVRTRLDSNFDLHFMINTNAKKRFIGHGWNPHWIHVLCIEASFCTAMTYKGREKIYKAASARRGGQKIYAFGIAGLEDRRSAGTGVESSGKVQKRRIWTEEWNIHLVFDLEAAFKWICAFMHLINRMWSRTNCQYVSFANFMSITSKMENKQAIVYNVQPLYEAQLKVYFEQAKHLPNIYRSTPSTTYMGT